MHPYIGPTDVGMTPSKELAERMEKLRADYIEACKSKDVEAQERIKRDERALLMLAPEFDDDKYTMPRVMRVRHYEGKTTIRDFEKRVDVVILHVYLDTHEIESLSVPHTEPKEFTVWMRSGRRWSVNEEDFNLLERAIRERK